MKVILTPQIRENLHEPGKNQFVEKNGTPKPPPRKMQRHLRRPFRLIAPLIRTNSDQTANRFRYYFCAVKLP